MNLDKETGKSIWLIKYVYVHVCTYVMNTQILLDVLSIGSSSGSPI